MPRAVHRTLPALIAAALAAAAIAQPVFVDRTQQAGIACTHTLDASSFMQTMVAGGAAGDFNNDGWQDLIILGGPFAPDRLYINNHDGTFSEQSAAWGLSGFHRGNGVAVADLDRDGLPDILITVEPPASGPSANLYYHNNGNGTLTEIAAAAGLAFAPGQAAGGGFGVSVGDIDLDGRLEVAVASWFPTSANRLYRSLPGASFTPLPASSIPASITSCYGFTPTIIDMDGDGLPDLLWVSDAGSSRYFAQTDPGIFADMTTAAGVGLDRNGMGSAVADLDNDGLPDWFVTAIDYQTGGAHTDPTQGNKLYMNLGHHRYAERAAAAGVVDGGWGWGAVAADFDNDGWVDLAHTNGWNDPRFITDQTRVFHNLSNAVFEQIAPACGVTHTGQGRGMLVLDYDNDGRMDLVVFTNNAPPVLYHNETPPPAPGQPGRHWLRISFDTRASAHLAPHGLGAVVTATTGGTIHRRWVHTGSGYLSQSELPVHIGLGPASTIDALDIRWPDGRTTHLAGIPADRAITIRSCAADYDASGALSVADIFAFLADWFAGSPAADFDGVAGLQVQDIFAFLAAWFAGC